MRPCHRGTFSFGEPCVGAGAHRRACVACPPGAQCVQGVWHPVPAAGRCYRKVEDCLVRLTWRLIRMTWPLDPYDVALNPSELALNPYDVALYPSDVARNP